MAELVYKNTDGRTYTYADQNELYKVLSRAGRSDFSWFHFSGGDNRIAMLPGEGEGLNIESEGSVFHAKNFESTTSISAYVSSEQGDGGNYTISYYEDEGQFLRQSVERFPIKRENMVLYDGMSLDSATMYMQYSTIHEHISCDKSKYIWFDISASRSQDDTSPQTRFTKISSENVVTVDGIQMETMGNYPVVNAVYRTNCSYTFAYRKCTGVLNTLNTYGLVGREKTIVLTVGRRDYNTARGNFSGNSASSQKELSLSEQKPAYRGRGIALSWNDAKLKSMVSSYTTMQTRSLTLSYVSCSEKEEQINEISAFFGQETCLFETEIATYYSLSPGISLTTTFYNSKPNLGTYSEHRLTSRVYINTGREEGQRSESGTLIATLQGGMAYNLGYSDYSSRSDTFYPGGSGIWSGTPYIQNAPGFTQFRSTMRQSVSGISKTLTTILSNTEDAYGYDSVIVRMQTMYR